MENRNWNVWKLSLGRHHLHHGGLRLSMLLYGHAIARIVLMLLLLVS